MQVTPVPIINGVVHWKIDASLVSRKLTKRVKGLHMITHDLKKAHGIFSELLKEFSGRNARPGKSTFDPEQLLWHAAVLAYARVFASGEARGPRLNDHDIKKMPPDMQKAHKTLANMRHRYLAHADSEDYEITTVFGILSPPPHPRGVVNVFSGTVQIAGPDEATYRAAIALVEYVMEVVEQKRALAEDELLSDLQKFPLEQLYSIAIVHDTKGK